MFSFNFRSQASAADALKLALNRADFAAIDAALLVACPNTLPDSLVLARNAAEMTGRA